MQLSAQVIEEQLRQDLRDLPTQQLPVDYRYEVFTDEELTVLREQAEHNLLPGGESGLFQIWRCAHCRQIKDHEEGGTSWTGPSVFSGAIGEDERHFLGLCCDACWTVIVKTLTEIYRKHL
jgi:hypothetical protein